MFQDRARIHVQAGRGGDGSLHFRREKHVPKGGPDGGDGGPGGDVVLVADPDLRDLSGFRRRRWFEAGRGDPGRGALKHGATGETVELRVPVGTQVFDADDQLIADLATSGARVIAARGGAPGRGNKQFATPVRRTPRFAETGLAGETAELELRLKLLADAALVGLPKVAEYPFTTLAPVLGTVDAPDGRQLTVADVPGLIEGASRGVGLGHEFLAHLERARLLVHVIDAAAGDPGGQFRQIDHELAEYGAGLDRLGQVVVINKVDLLPHPPELGVQDERIAAVFAVSAATGAGIDDFRRKLFELCPPEPSPETDPEGLADFLVYRPQPRAPAFRILRTDRGFRVQGSTPSSEELEAALRAAGARKGSEVEVGEETLVLE